MPSNFKSLIVIVFYSIILSSTQEITFSSANPFSFKDIITNIENLETQVVSGILTIPDNVNDNIPLVIGVAGSDGWGEHHFEYLKMYQDMGIATFQLQSFQSRGEISTVSKEICTLSRETSAISQEMSTVSQEMSAVLDQMTRSRNRNIPIDA